MTNWIGCVSRTLASIGTSLLLAGCFDQSVDFTLDGDYPCKGVRQEIISKVELAIADGTLLTMEGVNEMLSYIASTQNNLDECLLYVYEQSGIDSSLEVQSELRRTYVLLNDFNNVLTVNPKYCDLQDQDCLNPYLEMFIEKGKI